MDNGQKHKFGQLCESVINAHYSVWLKKMRDPHFIPSPDKARALATEMIRNARKQVEARFYRHDPEREYILSEKLQWARKKSERYIRDKLGTFR